MKKQILFVYDSMIMGGSTTSILSLLKNIDYNEYSVDLLLFKNSGPYFSEIPKEVNVLNEAAVNKGKLSIPKKRVFRSLLNGRIFKAVFYAIKHKKTTVKKLKLAVWQSTVISQLKYSRPLEKEYDTAVAFIENWPSAYVTSDLVKAKRKICWLHLDYINSYLIPEFDKEIYNKADTVVTVSENCKESFVKIFPQYKEKAVAIENLLTKEEVVNKSNNGTPLVTVDNNFVNFVTVCRVQYNHKGIDRLLNAFLKLKNEGKCNNFRWYLIGDGTDFDTAKKFVSDNNLNDRIFLLGATENPLPTVKIMDAFLLPSRFEGKPMAVTEALMLGLPCIVTDYASAKEQITDGYDGFILINTDNSFYEKFSQLENNVDELLDLKENVKIKDYSNLQILQKIYKIF